MPLVQDVSTSTPDTMVGTLPEAVASSTIPTAVIITVGISTASSRITWARRSCRFARGNRIAKLCHVGGLARDGQHGQRRRNCGRFPSDVVGDPVEVPDQADRREAAKRVVRDVDLPPEEA